MTSYQGDAVSIAMIDCVMYDRSRSYLAGVRDHVISRGCSQHCDNSLRDVKQVRIVPGAGRPSLLKSIFRLRGEGRVRVRVRVQIVPGTGRSCLLKSIFRL
jgi:hypothetical protein